MRLILSGFSGCLAVSSYAMLGVLATVCRLGLFQPRLETRGCYNNVYLSIISPQKLQSQVHLKINSKSWT